MQARACARFGAIFSPYLSVGPSTSLSSASPACSVRRILDKYARFIRLDGPETARLMGSVELFRAEHARQLAQEDKDKNARTAARYSSSSDGASTAVAAAAALLQAGQPPQGPPRRPLAPAATALQTR